MEKVPFPEVFAIFLIMFLLFIPINIYFGSDEEKIIQIHGKSISVAYVNKEKVHINPKYKLLIFQEQTEEVGKELFDSVEIGDDIKIKYWTPLIGGVYKNVIFERIK